MSRPRVSRGCLYVSSHNVLIFQPQTMRTYDFRSQDLEEMKRSRAQSDSNVKINYPISVKYMIYSFHWISDAQNGSRFGESKKFGGAPLHGSDAVE